MNRVRVFLAVVPLALVLAGFSLGAVPARAADGVGVWSDYENISNTPEASTSPTIAADRAGRLHVFWVEDVGGVTRRLVDGPDGTPILDYRGKPVNLLTDQGNTIYYTRWNGRQWIQPVDVATVLQGHVYFPSAAVDQQGTLHLIWTQGDSQNTTLMYSRVSADRAEVVQEWSKPVPLANPVLVYENPAWLAVDSQDGLHIVYFQVGPNPGVYEMNSFDGGDSWSNPTQLYANASQTGNGDGSMPVRLMVDQKDRLHATWTVFDKSGNGKSIYYARSTDRGKTWSKPFLISAWQPGYYEVDWLSAGASGDTLYMNWEGGTQSFDNERISPDGGLTWGPEKQIFPNLVGENGWADLVTDSSGRLNLLLVKRTGGLSGTVYGMWYSQLRGGMWDTPRLVGDQNFDFYNSTRNLDDAGIRKLLSSTINGDGLRYQRAAVVSGNELFVVVVNEHDGEIYSAHMLLDSPAIPPQPYPSRPAPTAAAAPVQTPTAAAPQPTLAVSKFVDPNRKMTLSPSGIFTYSMVPVVLLVLVMVASRNLFHRS
ncbi:MAG TPA: sialidase family protein [Anaerolineaceae bacterium]